jgi:cytidine deaminase
LRFPNTAITLDAGKERGSMKDDPTSLIEAASAARRFAHAPYSGFMVGCAVLDENGDVHCGCNVENAAYPEGICAEANAIGTMVANGGKRIVAIAAVGGKDTVEPCTPCGGCRQRILEFADGDTRVYVIAGDGAVRAHSIDELLPASFRL